MADKPDFSDPEFLEAVTPGLARLMPEVGARAWKLYYAAKAQNWPLARFQHKEAKKLLELCGLTRPKYKKVLGDYVTSDWKAVSDAIEAGDLAAFETSFARAIEEANRYHGVYNKPFLVWKVPDHPPPDLDMTPLPTRR